MKKLVTRKEMSRGKKQDILIQQTKTKPIKNDFPNRKSIKTGRNNRR